MFICNEKKLLTQLSDNHDITRCVLYTSENAKSISILYALNPSDCINSMNERCYTLACYTYALDEVRTYSIVYIRQILLFYYMATSNIWPWLSYECECACMSYRRVPYTQRSILRYWVWIGSSSSLETKMFIEWIRFWAARYKSNWPHKCNPYSEFEPFDLRVFNWNKLISMVFCAIEAGNFSNWFRKRNFKVSLRSACPSLPLIPQIIRMVNKLQTPQIPLQIPVWLISYYYLPIC